jgi:hypothetical protein
MEYQQHRHDGVVKQGEHIDPSMQAPSELHELLERKGFAFQAASDYYCYGKDEEWQDKPFGTRPLISAYRSGTWDGKPVEGFPMMPAMSLRDYLESLPDVKE